MNRVMVKAMGFAESYVGDPASYFYGVAKNVVHERDRRPPTEELTPNLRAVDQPQEGEVDERVRLLECLRKCLRTLERSDRDLVSSYYLESKVSKIAYRKVLAEHLRIETNTLRVRVCRLRGRIKQCVEDCLAARKS